MTETKTELGDIAQIALAVEDVDRATEFYRDTLGLQHLFAVPGMTFFDCGGIRLLLGLADDGMGESKGAVLYHRVDDMAGTYVALKDRGVEFRGEPQVAHRTEEYELWLAFFNDPDGNTLALMSETPIAGSGPSGE